MNQASQIIELPHQEGAIALAGIAEENLKFIARQTGARVILRGQQVSIFGQPNAVEQAYLIIQSLETHWREGRAISSPDILAAIDALDTGKVEEYREMQSTTLARTRRGELIKAKTFHQRRYVQCIEKHDITFCIGPAGTGKTFLAAVLAVQYLLSNQVEKIILTRPAVEAGEKLGFLPGDLQQKVDPFLRPLYDALYEFIEAEKIPDLMERGKIEVAPLAYMRGRTLNNAFVIVDEAQNTTPAQLKMVLTRLGRGSKMVVTGDITQTDLPTHQESGLLVASKILSSVNEIAFCHFSKADVIRHSLVQKIVEAYERVDLAN